MRRLPFLAGSLLAAFAVSACNSTQDVLEPSAIAASPPAPGALQSETGAGAVPMQPASTNTSAALNPGIAARTRLRFDRPWKNPGIISFRFSPISSIDDP